MPPGNADIDSKEIRRGRRKFVSPRVDLAQSAEHTACALVRALADKRRGFSKLSFTHALLTALQLLRESIVEHRAGAGPQGKALTASQRGRANA